MALFIPHRSKAGRGVDLPKRSRTLIGTNRQLIQVWCDPVLAPFHILETKMVLKMHVLIGKLMVDTLRLFIYIEKMSNLVAKSTAHKQVACQQPTMSAERPPC